MISGDPEREAEAIRSKEGIPLLKPVVDDLLDISKKTGIAFEAEYTLYVFTFHETNHEQRRACLTLAH